MRVVNLPTDVGGDLTHRHGQNGFKLYGLPTPRPGHILGLLGTNGIGKSTALGILSGKLKPNLGELDPSKQPTWESIVTYYRGSRLQNFFARQVVGSLRAAAKPQLDGEYARALGGRTRAWPHRRVTLSLARKIVSEVGRTDYVRVAIEAGKALPLATAGASILSSTVRAAGAVVVPRELEGMREGAPVEVLLYDEDEEPR